MNIAMEYSKPSLLFYALQILQSQPATSCFPIQPVSDENKRHAFAGTAGSRHEAYNVYIFHITDVNASPAGSTTDWLWKPA